MDRSVDSIGSCSLDVDAESTDFSDTSGSLNLQTPSSARDITREFTSRIKERCQISQINCQQTTAILDPNSGKISTIVATIGSPVSSPVKKPSYLNLACCVNGYSNLTTYDSKLRQNINKSREVSPIRPSSQTLQYCTLGNYLAPPILTNTNNNKTSSNTNPRYSQRDKMMENRNYLHTENGVDVTDNVCINGSTKYFQSTKYITSSVSNKTTFTSTENESTETKTKSFIQQRVERLYGPSALAQGFYSPKKVRSQYENSVLCERSPNTQNNYLKTIKTSYVTQDNSNLNTNSSKTSISSNHYENNSSEENFENLRICDDLPVLRHLRPEFRAQLPILSPKRSVPTIPTATSPPATSNAVTTASTVKDMTTTTNSTTAITNANVDTTTTSLVNGKSSNCISEDNVSCYKSLSTGETDSHVIEISNNNNNYNDNNNISAGSVKRDSVVTDKNNISSESFVNVNGDNFKDVKMSQNELSNTSSYDSQMPISVENANAIETVHGRENISCELPTILEPALELQKDGHYFLKILKDKQDRLIELAVQAEKQMDNLSNSNVSDEIFGYLRSASGKARLLATQKMIQFEGLCKNNLNQKPDEKFPTTNEDLQGFWDMVMLQVDHIEELFVEIESLRKNNWQKPEQVISVPPQGSKLTMRPSKNNPSSSGPKPAVTNGTSSKKSSAAQAAAQRREAQRKQLMELKRKNKIAMTAATDSHSQSDQNRVEIFVNEPSSS